MEVIKQNSTRKLLLILAGVLFFGVSIFGSYWLGRIQEKEQNRRLVVQQLDVCKTDTSTFGCTQDSDCPQGLVCVGRGPTKPSTEVPGVCASSKASQAVQ